MSISTDLSFQVIDNQLLNYCNQFYPYTYPYVSVNYWTPDMECLLIILILVDVVYCHLGTLLNTVATLNADIVSVSIQGDITVWLSFNVVEYFVVG